MPKYFCDYCDTYLTHDTPSVRKTHNSGRKHRENVRLYYQQWLEDQAQKLVDATARAFRDTSVMRGAVGMVPPPMLIPGPGMPLGMPPPGVPPVPGMPPAPYMFPPAGLPAVSGMPPRPSVVGVPDAASAVPTVPQMPANYYPPGAPMRPPTGIPQLPPGLSEVPAPMNDSV